jgi:hypothetical protein
MNNKIEGLKICFLYYPKDGVVDLKAIRDKLVSEFSVRGVKALNFEVFREPKHPKRAYVVPLDWKSHEEFVSWADEAYIR